MKHTMKTQFTADDIRTYQSGRAFVVPLSDSHCLKVKVERDDGMGPPWKEADGHWPVSEWETRDKRAGEWVLSTDRRHKRFYDAQEAQRIALKDGWGLREKELGELTAKLGRAPTKRELAAAAVLADFKFLQSWCNDEWEYVSVLVSLYEVDADGEPGTEVEFDSLGGIESLNDYWRDCAAEIATRLASDLAEELAEKAYWEERDTVTK